MIRSIADRFGPSATGRPQIRIGHLPTKFRSFGDPASYLWRPNFGHSPTARPKLANVSNGLNARFPTA